jgi:hypothetical protein
MPYALYGFMPCLSASWQNKPSVVLGKILGPLENLIAPPPAYGVDNSIRSLLVDGMPERWC